jgi:protein-S-isoprenylcysteine O-methyltransferase Ste14
MDALFHKLTVTLFVMMVLIRIYYWGYAAAHTAGKSVGNEGKYLFWVRMLIAVPGFALVFVFIYAPVALPWRALEVPVVARWLGVPLGALSLALLAWVHVHLGRNFSTTLHIREDHTLVTSGPYRWVRHPMYTAFILFATSFFLMSGEPVISAIFAVSFAIVMIVRTPREEKQLLATFGEQYRQYVGQTGRYLPRLKSADTGRT